MKTRQTIKRNVETELGILFQIGIEKILSILTLAMVSSSMTGDDDIANLTLEYLKRFDARLERISDDVSDLKERVGHLETSIAQQGVLIANMSNRMDRIDGRLQRIEKRLDLVEA